ncbi:MAG: hypothetical protein H6936_03175 [Burkholderiales bacterium]|nr:hypothetical protein [Burkholderiales bacterium]
MKTLEELQEEEKLGITRKTVSRYLEITFASMLVVVLVQGITSDWRLAFPCFITGLYWFVTNHHNNKVLISCAVYVFIVAVLMYYFDRGQTEDINCLGADNYLDCLKDNERTFIKALDILLLIWVFGFFVIYMSQQHKRKE